MTVKLIAIAQDDGWGFILDDDETFLLRPPYTSDDKIKKPHDIVGEMMSRGAHFADLREKAAAMKKIVEG